LSACREEQPASSGASGPGVATAVVPQPADLAAEIFVDRPFETWTALRALLPPGAALPVEYAALLAAVFGIPEAARTALTRTSPAAGVVLANGEETALVAAFPVQSGRAVLAALTSGKHARYASRRDAASGVVTLRLLRASQVGERALGVHGDVLLVASSPDALLRAGAFVAAAVARRGARPPGVVASLSERARKGTAVEALKAAWERQAAAGWSAPSGVQHYAMSWLGALLESAQQVRVIVQPGPDHLEARVEVEPTPGGLAHELFGDLRSGDASSLLALPAESALALWSPSSARSHQQSSSDAARTVHALFGDRLNAAERARLADALSALAQARGAYMTYALLTSAEPHFVLRGPVRDGARFEAGLAGLTRALEMPAVTDALARLVGPIAVRRDTSRLSGSSVRIQRARLTLRGQALELIWLARDGMGYAVLGPRPAPLLRRLLETGGADAASGGANGSLAGQVELAALVKQQSPALGFGAVVDPLRFAPRAADGAAAPLFVSLLKRGNTGVFRVQSARGALAALARPGAL
jgi:hypothetical protein